MLRNGLPALHLLKGWIFFYKLASMYMLYKTNPCFGFGDIEPFFQGFSQKIYCEPVDRFHLKDILSEQAKAVIGPCDLSSLLTPGL